MDDDEKPERMPKAKSRSAWLLRALIAALCLGNVAAPVCAAPLLDDDPLHAFCWGATPSCVANNANTPTSANPPQFGFNISPNSGVGDYRIEILVPNNEDLSPSSVTFSVMGGALSPAAASLFTATAWSSGKLDAYLGITASPANPIGAYLSSTQALDPSATAFYVYQADLGTNTLPGYPTTTPPDLNVSSAGGGYSPYLPEASFIVGFLDTGSSDNPHWIATANNGALFETDAPAPPNVPEPTSLALLGCALLSLSLVHQLRKVSRYPSSSQAAGDHCTASRTQIRVRTWQLARLRAHGPDCET